ncbi:hypothetical protein BC831DRAFT_122188 [Entophlyctis helioformis]|nr:hypothetical protein BC831DRAFT_122188 [Entophlyctis helioformis]
MSPGRGNEPLLPIHHMPDLVLSEATTAQDEQSTANSHPSWGAPLLTLEQYKAREAHQRACVFAQAPRRRCWVLTRSSDPVGTLDLVSHCETFMHDALLVGGDGVVHEGVCYSIASVFTPEAHRRRGYAAAMLKLLADTVIHADPGAIASALYSDVGPTYYAKQGWHLYPSISAIVSVAGQTSRSPADASSTSPLRLDGDLGRILDHDRESIEAALVERSARGSAPLFAILPSWQAVEWHHSSSVFYSRVLGRRAPNNVGIQIHEGTDTDSATGSDFAVWKHDFKNNDLIVLRCRLTSKRSASLFIAACLSEARLYGLVRVVIWDPSPLLEQVDEYLIEVEQRNESLSSLMLVGRHGIGSGANAEWCINEKFAWV